MIVSSGFWFSFEFVVDNLRAWVNRGVRRVAAAGVRLCTTRVREPRLLRQRAEVRSPVGKDVDLEALRVLRGSRPHMELIICIASCVPLQLQSVLGL